MYHPSLVARAREAADMGDLPQYFWLHITSTVVLAVLTLVATAALLALAVDEVEGLWRRHRSRGD